jgi:hypothetical protein
MAVRFSTAGPHWSASVTAGAQATFSYCGWVKIVVDTNASMTVLGWTGGGTTWAVLNTDATGTGMRFLDQVGQSTTVDLTIGSWYFLGLSKSGTAGTMYVREASATAFTTVAFSALAANVTATTNRVGEDSTRVCNATIAAAKFWFAQLTQAEFEAEMWQYLPARTANLTAHYPLLGAATTDYSGAGWTLTGSGGVAEDGPPISWHGGVLLPRPITVPAGAADATATPATVAGTTAVGSPVVIATAVPATVTATASIGTPVVRAVAQPGTVAGGTAIATPVVAATASPATIPGSTTIPAATVAVIATPATVAGAAAVAPPSMPATITPATVTGSATVGVAPPAVIALPATVAGATAIPAPIVRVTVLPGTVAGSAAVGVPTVTAGGGASITAVTVAGATAIPAPVVALTAVPATVAGGTSIAVPVPAATVLAATVAGSASVPAPVVRLTVTPGTVAGTTAIPVPTVTVGGADTTPPSVPANLHTITVGSTTADIGWDASTDNVAVTGYDIKVIGP